MVVYCGVLGSLGRYLSGVGLGSDFTGVPIYLHCTPADQGEKGWDPVGHEFQATITNKKSRQKPFKPVEQDAVPLATLPSREISVIEDGVPETQ